MRTPEPRLRFWLRVGGRKSLKNLSNRLLLKFLKGLRAEREISVV